MAVVLLAHVANFFNHPGDHPSGTEVVLPVALGYMVAFPLWAVQAYRDNIRGLLTPTEVGRLQSIQLAHTSWQHASSAPHSRTVTEQALDMVTGLVPTRLAAIGTHRREAPQRSFFANCVPRPARDTGYGRQINRLITPPSPGLRAAARGIELLPRGVGAAGPRTLAAV